MKFYDLDGKLVKPLAERTGVKRVPSLRVCCVFCGRPVKTGKYHRRCLALRKVGGVIDG